MTKSTKKICDRCNKNEVTNGTSLCDECYEEHNEIFGITNEFNPVQEKKYTSGYLFIPILIVIVITVVLSGVINSGKQISNINTVFEEKLDYTSFPENGKIIYMRPQYQYEIDQNIHGIITIQNTEDYAYLIKVIESETKEKIYEIFMRPENKVTITLMLGEYEIYLASGKKWIDEIEHFGKNTTYSRVDRILSINVVGDQISGWAIELQKRQDGNLRMEEINKEDW